MEWTYASYEEANHEPVVTLAEGIDISAQRGETVTLTAQTSDPDGDVVTVSFWQYGDADTYGGDVELIPARATRFPSWCLRTPRSATPSTSSSRRRMTTSCPSPAISAPSSPWWTPRHNPNTAPTARAPRAGPRGRGQTAAAWGWGAPSPYRACQGARCLSSPKTRKISRGGGTKNKRSKREVYDGMDRGQHATTQFSRRYTS